jgi:hypothetical protein
MNKPVHAGMLPNWQLSMIFIVVVLQAQQLLYIFSNTNYLGSILKKTMSFGFIARPLTFPFTGIAGINRHFIWSGLFLEL